MKLDPKGVIITLDVGVISGTKKITAEDLGLQPDEVPEEITLGTKRLFPKSITAAFRDYLGRAEYQLRKHSLAVPLGRFVPDKAVEDCLTAIAQVRDDYLAHKRHLIDNLDQIASEWMKEHPDLQLTLDMYPTQAYLEGQLRFNVGITQFQFPEGLEASFLGIEAAEQVMKSSDERRRLMAQLVSDVRSNFDSFAEECSRALLEEGAEIARKLLDQLRIGKINARTAESFSTFMKRFDSLNWMENESLQRLLGSAEGALKAFRDGMAVTDAEDNLRSELDRTLKAVVQATSDQAGRIVKDLVESVDECAESAEQASAEPEMENLDPVAANLLQGVL